MTELNYDNPVVAHLINQFDYESIARSVVRGARWFLFSGLVRTTPQHEDMVLAQVDLSWDPEPIDATYAEELVLTDWLEHPRGGSGGFGSYATEDDELFDAIERFYQRNKRRKDKGASKFGVFLRGRGDAQDRDAWSTLYWVIEEG